MMILLGADSVLVQTCGSCLVILGHCLQPLRSVAMRKLAGDAAAPLSMVQEGALLDAHHPATTHGRRNGPFAQERNSAMSSFRRSGKNSNIFGQARNMAFEPTLTQEAAEGLIAMYDACQLATAMLAIAFTALLLVTGQQFIEYRLQHQARIPIVAMATLPP